MQVRTPGPENPRADVSVRVTDARPRSGGSSFHLVAHHRHRDGGLDLAVAARAGRGADAAQGARGAERHVNAFRSRPSVLK